MSDTFQLTSPTTASQQERETLAMEADEAIDSDTEERDLINESIDPDEDESEVDEDEFRALQSELEAIESPPQSPNLNSQSASDKYAIPPLAIAALLNGSNDGAGNVSNGHNKLTSPFRAKSDLLDSPSPSNDVSSDSILEPSTIIDLPQIHSALEFYLARELLENEIRDLQTLLVSQRMTGVTLDALQDILQVIKDERKSLELNINSTQKQSHRRTASQTPIVNPVTAVAKVLQCEHVLPSLKFLRSPSSVQRGSIIGHHASHYSTTSIDVDSLNSSRVSATLGDDLSPTANGSLSARGNGSLSARATSANGHRSHRTLDEDDESSDPDPNESSVALGTALQKLQKENQRLSHHFNLLKKHNTDTEKALTLSSKEVTQTKDDMKKLARELEDVQLELLNARKTEQQSVASLKAVQTASQQLETELAALRKSHQMLLRKSEIAAKASTKYEAALTHARRRSSVDLMNLRDELTKGPLDKQRRLQEENQQLRATLADIEAQFEAFQQQQQAHQRRDSVGADGDDLTSPHHSRKTSANSMTPFSPDFNRAVKSSPSLGSSALFNYLQSMQHRSSNSMSSTSSGLSDELAQATPTAATVDPKLSRSFVPVEEEKESLGAELAEFSETTARLQELESKVKELEEDSQTKQERVDELELQLTEANAALVSKQARCDELEAAQTQLQQQLDEARQSAQTQLQKKDSVIGDFKSKTKQIQEESKSTLEAKMKEIARLEDEVKKLKSDQNKQIAHHETQLQELKSDLTTKQDRIATLEEEITKLTESQRSAERNFQTQLQQKDALISQLNSTSTKSQDEYVTKLTEQQAEAQREFDSKLAKKDELISELKSKTKQLQDQSKSVEESKSKEISQLTADLKQVQQEQIELLAKKDTQIHDLQTQQTKLESEISELKQKLLNPPSVEPSVTEADEPVSAATEPASSKKQKKHPKKAAVPETAPTATSNEPVSLTSTSIDLSAANKALQDELDAVRRELAELRTSSTIAPSASSDVSSSTVPAKFSSFKTPSSNKTISYATATVTPSTAPSATPTGPTRGPLSKAKTTKAKPDHSDAAASIPKPPTDSSVAAHSHDHLVTPSRVGGPTKRPMHHTASSDAAALFDHPPVPTAALISPSASNSRSSSLSSFPSFAQPIGTNSPPQSTGTTTPSRIPAPSSLTAVSLLSEPLLLPFQPIVSSHDSDYEQFFHPATTAPSPAAKPPVAPKSASKRVQPITTKADSGLPSHSSKSSLSNAAPIDWDALVAEADAKFAEMIPHSNSSSKRPSFNSLTPLTTKPNASTTESHDASATTAIDSTPSKSKAKSKQGHKKNASKSTLPIVAPVEEIPVPIEEVVPPPPTSVEAATVADEEDVWDPAASSSVVAPAVTASARKKNKKKKSTKFASDQEEVVEEAPTNTKSAVTSKPTTATTSSSSTSTSSAAAASSITSRRHKTNSSHRSPTKSYSSVDDIGSVVVIEGRRSICPLVTETLRCTIL